MKTRTDIEKLAFYIYCILNVSLAIGLFHFMSLPGIIMTIVSYIAFFSGMIMGRYDSKNKEELDENKTGN